MRCHKCHQDSINIKKGHIICDICDLDINISLTLEDSLSDLFIYNRELEEAEKLGNQSYIDGKSTESNPYSFSSNQIILNKRWEKGWTDEQDDYEKEALILSSGNLKKEITSLFEEKEGLLAENKEKRLQLSKIRDNIDLLDKKTYIFGRSYKKDISKIVEDIPDN